MNKQEQNDRNAAPRAKRGRKYGLIGAGAFVLAAGAFLYYAGVSPARQQTVAAVPGTAAPVDLSTAQFATVKRGDVKISLLAPGTVETKETTSIVSQIEGSSKILWVIDEGTMVKKGDKLIELEADGLDDRLYQQNADVMKGEAQFNTAEQALRMQELQNDSDLLSAENAVNIAELNLKKYNEGSYAQDTLQKQSNITIAEEELKRANQTLEWTRKLVDKGYVSSGDLESDQLTVKKQEIQLDLAKKDLNVYENYDHKADEMTMENSLREAKANLEKVKLDNQFKLKSKQIDVDSAKASLEHEKTRLAELQDQKRATVMYAPRDGMVVFANGDDRRDDFSVIVGADVRNRQKLLELPNFSAWMVETKVHESVIQQVKAGMEARIAVDAFPNRTIVGTVSKISVMPDSTGRWMSPDVKQYIVNVEIDPPAGMQLKPGMSSRNEILLDNLKNVLYVPIQAVSSHAGKPYVMLRDDSGVRERAIEVGKANDAVVEVKSGLEEGDQVMLLASGGNVAGMSQREAAPGAEGPQGQRGEGPRGQEPGAESQGGPGMRGAPAPEGKQTSGPARGIGESGPASEPIAEKPASLNSSAAQAPRG
jgi:RND family efflux transporter MFP subunit